MSPDEVQGALYEELSALPDWDARYRRLMEMGREVEPLPEAHRVDANLIKGCQSRVWIFPEMVDSRMHLFADSDALIVKGLVALVLRIFQDRAPAEVMKTELWLFEKLELSRHLSPTRANGLGAMVKQIRMYAFAFSARGNP